jgi:DNA-binding MarR family transcriptional regulator
MKKQREGGFLITQIHHRANRVFARMLEEHGIHEINPAQGRIMFVLWQNDGIPITELARQTSLDKSTLTSMLDRLEEAGFVARASALQDRRKVLVKRTEKDKAWQKVYAQVSQEMTKLFYDGFAESEVDEFEQYLRRILENLTASDSA